MLFERESARQDIAATLRDGGLLLIEGIGGIGKSALLTVAREQAVGMQVLTARAHELEQDWSFGVVRQLFESALTEADPRVLTGAAGFAAQRLALTGAPAASDPEDSFAVLHGLYWLTANLADRSPLCLLIDDAHWADPASLRYLAFLAPRLDDLRVAVVVAQRPVHDELRTALRRAPATSVLHPAPLSVEATAAWLGGDAEFAAAAHRATGGIPFVLGELARSLDERGIEPVAANTAAIDDVGAPAVGQWVIQRLDRAPAPVPAVGRAVAVLERAAPQDVATLANVGVDDVLRATDVLVEAGLFAPGRPLAFAHPLIRSGVYGAMARSERVRLHREAAAVLTGERAGEHLLPTDPIGDQSVVDRLLVAAEAALGAGAPESAIVYLERALAEPPANPAEVALKLSLAEFSAGRPTAAEHAQQALDGEAPRQLRLQAALLLAHSLSRNGRSRESLAAIDRAAELGDATLETLAVGVAMLERRLAPVHAARIEAARRRTGTRDELALAGLLAAERGEPVHVAADLARRAIAANANPWPAPGDPPWFPQAAVTLLWCEVEDVGALLDRAIDVLSARMDHGPAGAVRAYRAWFALERSDLLAAEHDARVAASLPGADIYQVLAVSILVDTLTQQGRLDEAEAALIDQPLESQTDAVLRLRRAQLRAAQGRMEEARDDAAAAGEVALEVGAVAPCWLRWRALAGRAEEELTLARAFGAPRGLAAALRAVGGEEHLRQALALAAPLERVRVLIDLGAVVKRPTERRELLREALDQAHRLHAGGLAEVAERALRAAGGRPRRVALTGFDALTASERGVVELAARGLTNREIGEALFVTARTVEYHLTRAYAKLGVSSREQLASVLPRSGEP